MKVGILAIGSELTSGSTQDTNSSFISRELNAQGWSVSSIMIVGDDEYAIGKGLDRLMATSDAVIVTGGLGPTADDITTASIAKTFGLNLYTDETVLNQIKERFERYRIKWIPDNIKQAMFPDGAVTIPNPIGTACGYFLKKNDKIVAVIPGVPSEAERMLFEGVIPVLKRDSREARQYIVKKTIKLFGLTEAKIDQILSDVDLEIPGVSMGFYPHFPENHIVITSKNLIESMAEENLKTAEKRIEGKLRQYIFGYDNDTLEGVVASLLKSRALTLSVAESCTGGLITDRLTNIPGSSTFLDRGVVVYSNDSKTELLGVPVQILNKFGAVSEETAILMAEGIRKLGKTDIGLATTGIAGPTGGTTEKPVGTVFIALTDGGNTICRNFLFGWERKRVKKISSQWALEILRRFLTGNSLND
ncbi:MAG: competence/damage-inducible protein A [Thermodesulfobacteriota bacterium]|nr:competence/damage-inducible protein A [Thermodesulfobacteriota bacterium]